MGEFSGKTILILGAGIMQLPAIRAAKGLGLKVVVADANPHAFGRAEADLFLAVDLSDADELLKAALALKEENGLDAVFTAGTDFSVNVARIASACGLPGLAPEKALAASDKILMRQTLRRQGLNQPDFYEAVSPKQSPIILESLPLPLVVKPVDSMGARGVRMVFNEEELKMAIEQALSFSRSRRVIVEEYIPGPEYSLDALVWNGKPYLCGFADRHIFFEPFFVELGHSMPTALSYRKQAEVREVFFKAIRALGIDWGAAKGDLKWGPQGPVVGEIAARLSGGYMSGWTYPYATGVELTKAAIYLSLGAPPPDLTPRFRKVALERSFISVPGVVGMIEGTEEVKALPHIKDLFVRVKPGDRVKFPTNNVEKCGNIIVQARRRQTALEALKQAQQRLLIRLKPLEPETTEFIFKTDNIFKAFKIKDDELSIKLKAMPGWYGSPELFNPQRPLVLLWPGFAKKRSSDWHGLSLAQAFAAVSRYYKIKAVAKPEEGSFLLGGVFWKAMFGASLQGVVYLLDCLTSLAPGERADFLLRVKAL